MREVAASGSYSLNGAAIGLSAGLGLISVRLSTGCVEIISMESLERLGEIRPITRAGGHVLSAELLNPYIITLAYPDAIMLWDTRISQATWTGNSNQCQFTCARSNGDWLVAAGHEDGNITLWDSRVNGRFMTEIDVHTTWVTDLAFHPRNSTQLFTTGEDMLLNRFNLNVPDVDDALEFGYCTEQAGRKLGFFGSSMEYIYNPTHAESLNLFHVFMNERINEIKDGCHYTHQQTSIKTEYIVDCLFETDNLWTFFGTHCGSVVGSFTSIDGFQPQILLHGAGHSDTVRGVASIGDGLLVTVGEDGCLIAWNTQIEATDSQKQFARGGHLLNASAF